jgi:hypothetical protein
MSAATISDGAAGRAESAKDAVCVVGLVLAHRLDDVNAYLGTMEIREVPNLVVALAGLAATLLQEYDAVCLRHGEPAHSGQFLRAMATATFDGQAHD